MRPGRPPSKHQNQKKRGFPPHSNNKNNNNNYPMYGSNYPSYSGPGPNFNNNNKKKRLNPSNNHFEEGDEPPIDSLFRILCPVRKIGSVLGRGGDIIKSLRAETNAKILVADPVPNSDDRVVIIYSLLTEQSNKEPPSSHSTSESFTPLCAAQDALLKVNDRIAADELYHGGGEEIEVTARILVPRSQAGCLIGKGGVIIKGLREQTGAGIKVLPPDFLPGCAMRSDELVQISGMPALVKKALYEISSKLHINPRKEQPPLNEIIYTSTHGSFSPPPNHLPPPHHMPPRPPFDPLWGPPRGPPPSFGYDGSFRDTSAYGYSKNYDEFAVRVLCPAWRIGGIIGKRGSNVRRLEEETGAHLQVEETVADEERVLAVSAQESLGEPVSQTIKFLVQIQSNTSPSDESVVTKLLVPSQKVGCIIGEGGNVINEMRRRTGAGIRVYTKDIRPGFLSPDDELVEIAGNPHTAREALIDVCTRLRTRTLRGDAPPFDFPPNDGFAPPPAGPGYPPGSGPSFPPPNHNYPPPSSCPNYPPPAGGYPPDPSGYPPPYAAPPDSGYAPPLPSYPAPSAAGPGYAPPVAESGYPPAGGNYPAPATSGYPAPASASYAPPAGPGYAAQSAYASQPAGTGYAPQPAGTGYAQAAGTGYAAQPSPGAGYPPAGSEYAPQATGESGGYPAPAAGGYVPPQTVSGSGGYSAPPPQVGHGYPGPAGSGYGHIVSQGMSKSPALVSQAGSGGYHGYAPQSTAQAHETHGYAGQPAQTGYHTASSSFEMRIPTASIEYVIGSDGSTITEIRKISGAKVTVRDPAPGSSECVVEILGSSEQIQSAQGLIHAYVAQQRPQKAQAPPVQAQYQAGPTWN